MEFVLKSLFRPLARLCIARGLRFSDVALWLRRSFLDVALELEGAGATDSRLSVMTGLQRRDIAKMRGEAHPPAPPPDHLSRLVAQWLVQNDGAPLPQHGQDSFDTLARQIRKDIHPRSMLDALAQAGTIRAEGEIIHLETRAHVPSAGSPEQLDYLARNLGDHLAVAVGNVVGEPAQFDLAVHYNGLSQEAATRLDALWRQKMRALLEDMNAEAARMQTEEKGIYRIRGGGYFRTTEGSS